MSSRRSGKTATGYGSLTFIVKGFTYRTALPPIVLLAAVLVFYARILFTNGYLIPWDFRGFHLPLAMAVFDAMTGAGSALWDTSTYCGRPLFADPQAQVFYPPTDLAVFVATFFGYSRLAYILEWELVLHVFAAGMFTYLMLRTMGACRAAALCGGLVFELGGFFASQTQHLDVVEAAAWMPLMWAAAWRLRAEFNRKWFGVLSLAAAMSILAGIPAMATTAIASTLLYLVILLVFREAQWRGVARGMAAVTLAVGLSGIMLAPGIQLTLLSVAKYRTDWFDGWGFPLQIFATLIPPPSRGGAIDLIYCGIAGLGLAAIAVFNKSTWKSTLPLFCLTISSAIWMLGNGTVWGRTVWAVTPNLVKGSLYPYYAMAPFCLGMAALAGLGLDRIGRLSAPYKYAIAALAAADLIAAGSGLPMNAFEVRKEPGITRDQINGSAATLLRLRELTGGQPPSRTDTHQSSVYFSTTAPLSGIPTASGYNPLVLERLIQARLSFAKGERWGAWYEVENLASPMLDAMSLRYIISGKPIEIGCKPIAAVANGTSKYVLKAELPGFSVYENTSALPRFWLVRQVNRVRSPEEAFAGIHRADFRPAEIAIVEDAGPADWRTEAGYAPAESVRVILYSPREVTLALRTGAPAFLVSSEVHYPGWRAWIDGAEVPIRMTNGAFRGVFVPAGEHAVRFRFMPWIIAVGAAISALSACALSMVCGRFPLGRRPRDNRVTAQTIRGM